jgi:DNA-directed RNA polymerase subunit F
MIQLEDQKDVIIEDYKSISLSELCKKYVSTKYLMRKFLEKNGVEIRTPQTINENIIRLGVKKCCVCNLVLPLEKFHKSNNKCGYRSHCRKCRTLVDPYRPEYFKKWRKNNSEIKSKMDKEYRERNSEKIKLYRSTLEYKNKKASWDKKRYEKTKKDPLSLLKVKIKSSMSTSIRYSKKNKYFEILGYTVEDLKERLEQTFTSEMSWGNYGRGGWHIDHIKPLALFDMSQEEDFIKAWSLSNLQALGESENCSKGSIYENKRHYNTR